MRKKIISITLVGIMAHFICACGRIESTEASNTGSELVQEEASENETMQDETSYEMPDWLAAYVDYAEKLESEYQDANVTYSFIYVDADDIPELVIYPGYSIYHILTFHDGEIDELTTDRATACYIEKKNLLDNYSGAMGFYHDYIYSIENGKWVYVTGGEYYERCDEKNKQYFFVYKWEDEDVTEDVYKEKLNEALAIDQTIEPENFESLEDILSRLQM